MVHDRWTDGKSDIQRWVPHLKICAITAGIMKYKSILKKKKKKYDNIVLLRKDKLNTTEVLIYKALINSYISHVKFVSVNNVLSEYLDVKEEIKIFVQYIKTMETYCVSCKKNTPNENSGVRKTKQNRLMLLSNCAVCGKKKSALLNNFNISNDQFKMNKIINTFLLAGDKFMPELHLKQLGFTYSASEPFPKHCDRIQKFITR